jgi:hypothetical protein
MLGFIYYQVFLEVSIVLILEVLDSVIIKSFDNDHTSSVRVFPVCVIIIDEDSFVVTSRQFGIDSYLQCTFNRRISLHPGLSVTPTDETLLVVRLFRLKRDRNQQWVLHPVLLEVFLRVLCGTRVCVVDEGGGLFLYRGQT